MDNFINHLHSFSRLSATTVDDLMACVVIITLDKHEVLLKEGQVCHYLYFVHQGLLKQYYYHHDKEIIDYFAYENKFVSGIGSFFRQQPSLKIIEAIEPSILYAISYTNLERLFAKHHDLERVGRLIATDAFILMEQRIYSLQFHTAEKRYHDLISNNTVLLNRVPLGQIASYLGITQVTLSRIRSKK